MGSKNEWHHFLNPHPVLFFGLLVILLGVLFLIGGTLGAAVLAGMWTMWFLAILAYNYIESEKRYKE